MKFEPVGPSQSDSLEAGDDLNRKDDAELGAQEDGQQALNEDAQKQKDTADEERGGAKLRRGKRARRGKRGEASTRNHEAWGWSLLDTLAERLQPLYTAFLNSLPLCAIINRELYAARAGFPHLTGPGCILADVREGWRKEEGKIAQRHRRRQGAKNKEREVLQPTSSSSDIITFGKNVLRQR